MIKDFIIFVLKLNLWSRLKNIIIYDLIKIDTRSYRGALGGALSSINILYDLRRFSNKLSQTRSNIYS